LHYVDVAFKNNIEAGGIFAVGSQEDTKKGRFNGLAQEFFSGTEVADHIIGVDPRLFTNSWQTSAVDLP
jgi:hypothetical protein